MNVFELENNTSQAKKKIFFLDWDGLAVVGGGGVSDFFTKNPNLKK